MKILLVEDDQALQRATVRMLRIVRADAQVLLAQTYDEAVAHLAVNPELGLILCDYNLIGPKTGGDVLEWIKTNRPELVEKFVFVSGNDEVRKLHDRYIVKPCFPGDIRALLR